MKWMLSLLALATVVAASPSISQHQYLPVNPGGIGGLFKGPNSEILIKGPDGSVITAANEGGEVHTGLADAPIVAAEPSVIAVSAAPTLAAVPNLKLSAPASQYSGPIELSSSHAATSRIAVAPPVVSPIVETVAVAAPAVESEQSSDVHGSSGRILTKGSKSIIAGPASTTIADGHGVVETAAIPSTIAAASVVATVSPVSLGATATPIIGSTVGVHLGSTVIPASGSNVDLVAKGIALNDVALDSTAIPTLTQGVYEASIGNSPIRPIHNLGPSTSIPQLVPTAEPVLSTAAPHGRPLLNLQSSTIVNTLEAVATPTLAPQYQVSSAPATPLFTPTQGPVINGSPSRINGRIDLGPPIQLTGHFNQLTLDQALIPSANIIPPEIGIRTHASSTVAPNIVSSSTPSLVSSPRAPGLISVSTVPSSGIQRNEIDATIQVPLSVSTASPLDIRDGVLTQQDPRLQGAYIQDPGLQNVNLQDPRLQSVNLQDPRLQNVQDPRLQSVSFQDPRLQNVQDPSLQSVNLQGSYVQNVNIQDPRLQNINLQDPGLPNVNLQDHSIQSVNLQDPRLHNIQDPRLQSVNLQGTNVQSVNLQDPRLQNVNIQDPRLQNINIQDPRLQNINLQNPGLQDVNLQDHSIQSVNLQDPRLQNVNVQDPRLHNVNLQDPRVQSVNLQDLRLQSINLQGVRHLDPSLQDPRIQSHSLQDAVPSLGVVGVPQQIQPAPVQELVDVTPRSNGVVLDGRLSLANVQQQDILSAELAKSGIDAAEVHLTTVPLSSVSRVVNPVVDSRGGLRGVPTAEAWNRWGRETKEKHQ